MKKIKFYERRKHTNPFTYELISYSSKRNHVYVVEFHFYKPRTVALFPATVFSDVIRDAKVEYMKGTYDIELAELIKLALDQYFKNIMVSAEFWRLAKSRADFIFSGH